MTQAEKKDNFIYIIIKKKYKTVYSHFCFIVSASDWMRTPRQMTCGIDRCFFHTSLSCCTRLDLHAVRAVTLLAVSHCLKRLKTISQTDGCHRERSGECSNRPLDDNKSLRWDVTQLDTN